MAILLIHWEFKSVVEVGEGDTPVKYINDVQSAIAFHVETFEESVLEDD